MSCGTGFRCKPELDGHEGTSQRPKQKIMRRNRNHPANNPGALVRAVPATLLATALVLEGLRAHAETALQISPARGLPNYTTASLATGTAAKGFYPTFALGDFNEDGRLDTIVLVGGPSSNPFPLGVTVYLQNSDHTLTKKTEYDLPTTRYTWY